MTDSRQAATKEAPAAARKVPVGEVEVARLVLEGGESDFAWTSDVSLLAPGLAWFEMRLSRDGGKTWDERPLGVFDFTGAWLDKTGTTRSDIVMCAGLGDEGDPREGTLRVRRAEAGWVVAVVARLPGSKWKHAAEWDWKGGKLIASDADLSSLARVGF